MDDYNSLLFSVHIKFLMGQQHHFNLMRPVVTRYEWIYNWSLYINVQFTSQHMGAYTQGAVLVQCGVARCCLVASLIGSRWFQASLHWRAAVWRRTGAWANLRHSCTCFGTNPPAGETVPCVKVPFRPLATAQLPFTNSALCKRSSGNGATGQRCAALHKNSALCKSALSHGNGLVSNNEPISEMMTQSTDALLTLAGGG